MDQREINRLAAMNRDASMLVGEENVRSLFEELQRVNTEQLSEQANKAICRPSQPGKLRNKPCPCGSGLKFKKCCMNKEL